MPKPMAVRWRWARNGALVGLVIALADMFLAWRGPRYYPWSSAEMIASNVGQLIATVGVLAFIGFVLGALTERQHPSQLR
jgi:hypothetical protein